ncbi:putative proton-dependent oligopeptide transporter family, MFS transporter superfamily [Helianthus annuus]|nr:putative proton-dependent oligopeptide transporter family, MFS transporter superfamily [Helianthus annuus]KAJ0784843.1 putative proton-dependent oligopeptide transporter family, MFS transporter superfamily [Helianthus annuus]KAJ0958736.1 putative proton-dependent oligopeptide transporter family, MFS transporter superfamily [Helianthus annuus]
MSLVVLQALAMDRHLGLRFQISAGTMPVFATISSSISLALMNCFLLPLFHKLTRTSPTLLKRIGIGHILSISSMALSALVESKRLTTARTHKLTGNSIVPMSVFWMGVGVTFMFPGQVMFYYQEFPKSIKSTAAAMVAVVSGTAYYLGTAVVDLIRKTTGWLPDGINDGRMDNVYWLLAVVGLINFGYYLVCSWMYKYQNVENKEPITVAKLEISDQGSGSHRT